MVLRVLCSVCSEDGTRVTGFRRFLNFRWPVDMMDAVGGARGCKRRED